MYGCCIDFIYNSRTTLVVIVLYFFTIIKLDKERCETKKLIKVCSKIEKIISIIFYAVSAVTAYWGGNSASHGNTAGINSSWNQLFKRGISNQNARKYFYKTAHNSDGIFVLSSLIKSLYKSAAGSGVIVGKNYIKGKLG